MTGTAFNNQPTYGNNPPARHRCQPANQQGDWWIGGYENRPSSATTAGKFQGDGPQGTLTSPFFKIVGKQISFLIGGGCDNKTVRAELIIGHQVRIHKLLNFIPLLLLRSLPFRFPQSFKNMYVIKIYFW